MHRSTRCDQWSHWVLCRGNWMILRDHQSHSRWDVLSNVNQHRHCACSIWPFPWCMDECSKWSVNLRISLVLMTWDWLIRLELCSTIGEAQGYQQDSLVSKWKQRQSVLADEVLKNELGGIMIITKLSIQPSTQPSLNYLINTLLDAESWITAVLKEQCISRINEQGLKNTLEKFVLDFEGP